MKEEFKFIEIGVPTVEFEAVADCQHEIWSHWMKYLFTCGEDLNGDFVIPKEKVDRWKRQMKTSYDELTEKEKDSDRDQAKKVFTAILNSK